MEPQLEAAVMVKERVQRVQIMPNKQRVEEEKKELRHDHTVVKAAGFEILKIDGEARCFVLHVFFLTRVVYCNA